MTLSRTAALATSAVLLGALTTGPAGPAAAAPAVKTAATAACRMTIGSITPAGDIGYTNVSATPPFTTSWGNAVHMFTPGIAKLSTTWTYRRQQPSGHLTSGMALLNTTLYNAWYGKDANGKLVTGLSNAGTGWGGYTYVEQTSYWTSGQLVASYRLRADGVLYRYERHWDGNPYDTVTRFNGFAAVKTMALISETPTYDTFLANTRGGALYTIRIPRAAGKLPIVTKIRTSTWQGFEHLIAERCGAQSTLLAGIDKDSGKAYLYAMSHANGTATVIKGLGEIPGTTANTPGSFTDPAYYLSTTADTPPLYGE